MSGPRDLTQWLATLAHVIRHPRSSRETICRYQGRQLQTLVRSACERVPFYRDLYARSGVDPSSVRDLSDLQRLPMVAKEALRAAPCGDILARGTRHESLRTYRTSGSTGTPFAIRRTAAEDHLLRLFQRRALHQIGVRPHHRRLAIKEPPLDKPSPSRLERLAERMGEHRTVLVSCFDPIETIADQLEQSAADVVFGYPGVLAQIAGHLIHSSSPSRRPKLIYAGGEPLQPHHRQRIEAGFGSRVFDLYATHEFNTVGWECPTSGLIHACEDNVIVEVLKDGRPARDGESGEVVVTGLHTRTLPFIRYLTRDIATRGPSPCPCGQPFSTLRAVEGRTPHYLKLLDGKIVHPYEITGPLIEEHGEWIDQHQVVQKKIGEVTLRIASLRTPPDGALLRLKDLGQQTLGTGATFCIEVVTTLRPEKSGKFRSYVSCIAPELGDPTPHDSNGEIPN